MNLECEFADWLDRRDPAALNRVFDATAGRLLLLAAHVGGTGASAEDLVQATFLAAMAHGATWDRQRPVWPWLAAILQNEARMELRRRRRRREVGLAAAADATEEGADPVRLAASDEAFAAVMAAIDALPLPYRQVLRLRLVHGLRNVEIAHSLERPVGTVRAQVHRGLARLREALPAGVASVAGAWLAGEGVLLAQVRARVVAEVATMHGATTSVAIAAGPAPTSFLRAGGWWTMNGKTVGFLAAGAALLLLVGFVLDVPPIFGSEEQASVPPTLTAGGEDSPASAPKRKGKASLVREVESTQEDAWPLVVTVSNRAGQPIEGADVQVWFDTQGGEHRDGVFREDIAKGLTAVDGTFRCGLGHFRSRSELVRLSSLVWVSARYAGGYTRNVLGFPRVTRPRRFTVELKLSPAIAVVGRVVDGAGFPVVGADLYRLRSLVAGVGTKRFERSGSDGRFCISAANPTFFAGGVAAVHANFGVAVAPLPRTEDLPDLGGSIDLGDIMLMGGDSIRGRVVLGDGTGLGGFPLSVRALDPGIESAAAEDPKALYRDRAFLGKQGNRLEYRGGRFVQTSAGPVTAADGSFVCVGLDPGAAYVVSVRDARMQWTTVVARVGGEPIVLTVDRQLFLLDVRDESGEVLPGAKIVAKGFDPASKRSRHRARAGLPAQPYVTSRCQPIDARGRRMLLSPFGWNWDVGSFDEHAREVSLKHDAIAGVFRVEKTLVLRPETRFGALQLVVVDERGQPWPRFAFELRCLDRNSSRDNTRLVPPADGTFLVRDLFAGRWRLTTYLGQDVFFPLPAHVRGAQVQEIRIEDGRTTEVRIESRPAGLVGFRLRSASPPAGGVWQELKIRSGPLGVEVPLHFYDAEQSFRSGGTARYGRLALGKPAFRPGEHEFVITAKGYRAARCRVLVSADRHVVVDVELFAQ